MPGVSSVVLLTCFHVNCLANEHAVFFHPRFYKADVENGETLGPDMLSIPSRLLYSLEYPVNPVCFMARIVSNNPHKNS